MGSKALPFNIENQCLVSSVTSVICSLHAFVAMCMFVCVFVCVFVPLVLLGLAASTIMV